MHELLHNWLASQHVLGIPGWGTLRAVTTNPEIDFINKQITPPQQHIDFIEGVPQADKNFYQWLAVALETDETTAIRRFNDFVSDVKEKLQLSGSVVLPGIGVFENTETAKPSFIQQQASANLFTAIRAEKIMRHQDSFNVLQGDTENTSLEVVQQFDSTFEETEAEKWWVTALFLFAAGIITILFYYLS